MADIQDYSFIDQFLQDSVKSYKQQLFGDYDEDTGYFPELNPEADQPDGASDGGDEEANEGVNDNQEEEMSEGDMYDSVYPEDSLASPNLGGVAGPVSIGKEDLKGQIASKESQGSYTAVNPHSSAVGKYQFLWKTWGDDIMKVTGVRSKEEFRNNPQAQERYYAYYEKQFLLPEVSKIKKEIRTNLTDAQLAKLVHFRGLGGARQYLRGQLVDKPEEHNIAISKYIKQAGGVPIARTKQQQYMGLNDENLDELILPLQGENIIRGLDSGSPVMIEDETGKRKVLRGPKHKAKMKGRVYEKKL